MLVTEMFRFISTILFCGICSTFSILLLLTLFFPDFLRMFLKFFFLLSFASTSLEIIDYMHPPSLGVMKSKSSMAWIFSFLIHLLKMSPFGLLIFWLFCEERLIPGAALTPVHLSPTLWIALKPRPQSASSRICLPLWSRASWILLEFDHSPLYLYIYLSII